MKLGLLTAALGQMTLQQIAAWASQAGYEALEVAAWPVGSEHIHQAAHLDVAKFTPSEAARVRDLVDQHGLALSAITYCGNNLHCDADERDRTHQHLRACIDAAAALGVRRVTTFIGRDITLPVADNLKLAELHLPPLTQYAADRGVKLLAENCPMEGWHPDGYPANLAYSPELWDWMASLGFGLTYDPSHLPWIGSDPLDALHHALKAGMVGHVQAKDIQINEQKRTHFGVFGKTVGRTSPPTPDGGNTASPGWGNWTGRPSSTRSTQPDTTATSPSSTRTQNGAARSTRPYKACRSPCTPYGPSSPHKQWPTSRRLGQVSAISAAVMVEKQYELAYPAWPIPTPRASKRLTITYSDLAEHLDIHARPIRHVFGVIQDWCMAKEKPPPPSSSSARGQGQRGFDCPGSELRGWHVC
jgi:sugar phosphate isomerase/epimerase